MNTQDYQAYVDAAYAVVMRVHREHPGPTADLLHAQAEKGFDILSKFVPGLIKPGRNLDGTPKK